MTMTFNTQSFMPVEQALTQKYFTHTKGEVKGRKLLVRWRPG